MAGSWQVLADREGYLNGSLAPCRGVVREFTSDAADATVPTLVVDEQTGWISAIDVEFDGTVPPTSVVVTLKTATGVTLETSETLTASGRVKFDSPQELVGGWQATVTCVGNSKKAKVVFYAWK